MLLNILDPGLVIFYDLSWRFLNSLRSLRTAGHGSLVSALEIAETTLRRFSLYAGKIVCLLSAHKLKTPGWVFLICARWETWTPDLFGVNELLYQLS